MNHSKIHLFLNQIHSFNADFYGVTEAVDLAGFWEFIEDCSAVSETGNVVSAVYPNPTDGIVKIEAKNIQNVSIFNVLGEKILETSISDNIFEYDFRGQEAGIYLIKVETLRGVETRKVTVK